MAADLLPEKGYGRPAKLRRGPVSEHRLSGEQLVQQGHLGLRHASLGGRVSG